METVYIGVGFLFPSSLFGDRYCILLLKMALCMCTGLARNGDSNITISRQQDILVCIGEASTVIVWLQIIMF